jgi:hypothetical protein
MYHIEVNSIESRFPQSRGLFGAGCSYLLAYKHNIYIFQPNKFTYFCRKDCEFFSQFDLNRHF